MAHWLLKSEPASYSWDQLVKDGRTHWNGVRNFQAANNRRAMPPGDRAFFYHSNEGKDIVGVVEIVRSFYPDPGDASGKFGMVDVAPVMPVKQPVSLAEREKKWDAFQADAEWIAKRAETEKDGPINARVENSFLVPTSFSSVK